MASFFSSNPFSNPVGQRIERATDEKLASEDWALNIEICDIINETDEGPKDAIKAIRKRLSSPKDFKVVMFTLTVLETCVKNCNRRFHVFVATQDFLHELTKLLQPKYNAPVMIQDKILALIQTWADAFKGKPELDAVQQVYNKLKTQGIQFPAQDLDSFSPIYTPERSVPEQQPELSEPTHHMVPGLPAAPRPRPATSMPPASHHSTGPRTLTPEKLAKLRSQLDVVQGNVQVMSEMLIAVKPDEENPDDRSLLKELNRTCRAMQTRIVQLLDQVGSEEVTEELLRVNDDLNNVFIRYDRYERNRASPRNIATLGPAEDQSRRQPSPEPPQNVVQLPEETETREPNTASLIDFGDSEGNTTSSTQEMDERIARQFGEMGVSQAHSVNSDEFDMFAQTRQNTFEDSRRMGSTYEDNSSSLPDRTLASAMHDQPSGTTGNEGNASSPIEGVEDWLTTSDLPSQQPVSEQTSMTSSEFDAFLQQRAVSGGSRASAKSKPGQRQIKKDVDESDDMFGL